MPYEMLQYIVGRALVDPSFQKVLLTAPDDALAELPLTEDERSVLIRADAPSFQKLAKRADAFLESLCTLGGPACTGDALSVRWI